MRVEAGLQFLLLRAKHNINNVCHDASSYTSSITDELINTPLIITVLESYIIHQLTSLGSQMLSGYQLSAPDTCPWCSQSS